MLHITNAAALLCGLAWAATGVATPVFAPVLNIATDFRPGGVVVGDFNNDGVPDLFVINFTTVSVLLGKGDGTYNAPVTSPISANASLGDSADFNGDGKLDVIISNFAGSNVFLLLGNGDGTFKTPVSIPSGLRPLGIVAQGLNGDGKPDLIVANNGENTVSVLLNNGDGTFAPRVNYPVGVEPRGIVTRDFDDDGNIDIAVANFGGNVSVLMGMGNGTFRAAVQYPAGVGPHAVTSGDFNDDGFSDLAVTNNVSGTVSVLLGNGDGTFNSAVNFAVGAQPRYIVATDLDGDGNIDLAVTSNGDNVISVLSGKGDGTFAAPVNFAVGSTPNDLQVADLDGDGRLDLVAANFGSGSISILINKASPCTNFNPMPGQVVEFYNNILNNFFITGDPIEQKAVRDGAAGPGWCATGEHFTASGPAKVCRFYGSLSPGPNSHFYTIDPAECQQLKDLQATTPITQKRWNFESNDFSSASPVGGACGAGLIPVYRAYNDGFRKGIDSNHRITSNQGDYIAQIAKGWIGEGIVMCAPAPTQPADAEPSR